MTLLVCLGTHAPEVEIAVASRGAWGGDMLRYRWPAWWVGGGGVGRGSRGYVNGAAVNVAQGFEW